MRFMVMVKATKDSEAGVMPSEEGLAAMAKLRTGCSRAPRASACASPRASWARPARS
jgi:hypothetical protein